MSNEIVKYTTENGEVTLSNEIIRNYLVSGDKNKVTDQELEMFLRLCQYQQLNPFLKEAYLIKFGNDANIIVGKDVFTKRAKNNPAFKGFKAGIIIENGKGDIEFRSGTFYSKSKEKLLGGFCNVYIDGWDMPLEHTVAFEEFNKGTATWKNMPAVMIRKVALVQALREAFPEDFQGMYDTSEMGTDIPSEDMSIALSKTRIKHEIDSYGVIDEAEDETDYITDAQRKRMFAIANSNEKIVKAVIKKFGYESTKDIEKKNYESICDNIETLRMLGNKSSFREEEIDVIEEQMEL